MDGCRHRRDFDQRIDDGDLTAATSMADIPYIGPFFSARLRRLGFATVNDLVLYFNRRPALFIYNGLSTLLQNPRRNQCLDDDYHVADFNVCAFASLRNLLRVLHERREEWRDLGFSRKPTFPALPGPVGRGHASTRRCSCLGEGGCRGDRTCRWLDGICTPRFGPGFSGVADRPGQREDRQGDAPAGLRYDRRWRRPGGAPMIRLPRAQPPPRRSPRFHEA